MNMNINLPSEIESQLLRSAAAAGTDIQTFVQQLISERLSEAEPKPENRRISLDEFVKRQDAWVKLHPVLDHAIDDSRESIYEGRDG